MNGMCFKLTMTVWSNISYLAIYLSHLYIYIYIYISMGFFCFFFLAFCFLIVIISASRTCNLFLSFLTQ